MPCRLVVGGFWGDEGKGKIISYLALKDKLAIGARGGVGPNAGHSVQYQGKVFKLRMLPTTFLNANCRLLVGAGVLVNPKIFIDELQLTNSAGRAGVDSNCAIIEEKHIEADKASAYLSNKIGTTGTGTGPCNVERVQRTAKTAKDVPELSSYTTDVAAEVNGAIDEGKNVLIEGTQGTFLSVYHGTYPYCTSKDVTASSICGDVGVGPKKIDNVLIIFKAYVTRVGCGLLPGELSEEEASRRGWTEIGTVTGRARRAAPFNFDLAKRAVMLNGATEIAITKFDIVFPESKGAKDCDQFSSEAKDFIQKVEAVTKLPVKLIGTGPDTDEIIDLR
ncbi:MAG: adenylosuccinate synthetase [Candidatus Bathyarchaeota archaeon]